MKNIKLPKTPDTINKRLKRPFLFIDLRGKQSAAATTINPRNIVHFLLVHVMCFTNILHTNPIRAPNND